MHGVLIRFARGSVVQSSSFAVMLSETIPVVHSAPLARQPVLSIMFAAWLGMCCNSCRRG